MKASAPPSSGGALGSGLLAMPGKAPLKMSSQGSAASLRQGSAASSLAASPRMVACRAMMVDAPPTNVLELEVLSSKGIMAAECFIRYEGFGEGREFMPPSRSAPDLTSLPPTSFPTIAGAQAPIAERHHHHQQSVAARQPTGSADESSLAACLATPLMEEESLREMMHEELRRAAAENEAQLQLRYAREVRRPNSRGEEEEEWGPTVMLNAEKRKRKAQYGQEELPASLLVPGEFEGELLAKVARDDVTAELDHPEAQNLLAGTYNTDHKNKLHLERQVSELPAAVAEHEMAQPDKQVFECAVGGECVTVEW